MIAKNLPKVSIYNGKELGSGSSKQKLKNYQNKTLDSGPKPQLHRLPQKFHKQNWLNDATRGNLIYYSFEKLNITFKLLQELILCSYAKFTHTRNGERKYGDPRKFTILITWSLPVFALMRMIRVIPLTKHYGRSTSTRITQVFLKKRGALEGSRGLEGFEYRNTEKIKETLLRCINTNIVNRGVW